MRYPLIIHPPDADGIVTIEVEGLGGVTEGDGLDEALANVPDMVFEVAAGRIAHGLGFPTPPETDGRRTVAIPTVLRLKQALLEAIEETGVSRADLARRLRIPRQRMTQLLDPAHKSRIGQLEAALEALGREVVLNVRKVA
jgi:antitoxin HicB